MFIIKKYKSVFLLLCLIITGKYSSAQEVTVKASIDTDAILIGQQFHLNFDISYPKTFHISFPAIPDTFQNLQVVQRGKTDTISGTGNLQLRQSLTLTGFDSGQHVLPPFQFAYRRPGDTTNYIAETNPLAIIINTVPVDTTKEIKDIKAPITVPYTFADFIPYILGAILLGLLIFGIIYFIRKSNQKTVLPQKYIPKRPAHEIAIEELARLREEKLWQQGSIKQYYTRLTDIVRTYIERRFKINALEFTSDELMNSIAVKKLESEPFHQLKYIVELSDMVKFAKALPIASEHEMAMTNGFEFINATKQVPKPVTEKEEIKS